MSDAQVLPEWVRPPAAALTAVEEEAHRRIGAGASEHGRLDGVLSALSWVRGDVDEGPVTGRTAVSRAVVLAEMWAATPFTDGGATPQRLVRGATADLGVPYLPPIASLTLDEALGVYQTLSWLVAAQDGWERGRRAPVEAPAATAQ